MDFALSTMTIGDQHIKNVWIVFWAMSYKARTHRTHEKHTDIEHYVQISPVESTDNSLSMSLREV